MGRSLLFSLINLICSLTHVLSRRTPDSDSSDSLLKQTLRPRLIQNANTTKYAINGSGLPDVTFDIGESYAGLLPITTSTSDRQLYFWYFPSNNPASSTDLVVWLNGGPGCSSLEGLLQENGPFLWQYGTYKPVRNPYTWVNITDVLWVDQPVGTGFSTGNVDTVMNEDEMAQEFLGFLHNFMDTFDLKQRKLYITGESYAGYYAPYIADAMYKRNDTEYFDVRGMMIYDPVTTTSAVSIQAPAIPFVEYHRNLVHLNDTYLTDLQARDAACGYADFRDALLQFPPPATMLNPPNSSAPGCDVYFDIINAAYLVNPCFNTYHIATTCPLLYDVLGYPGNVPYSPMGAPEVYFNRQDVKQAINAPTNSTWTECRIGPLQFDKSPLTGLSILPRVIEKNERTIIAHGQLDMNLIANGTLMMIQNLSWAGKQGFQAEPRTPFVVPNYGNFGKSAMAGSGQMGVMHNERKLTWIEVWLSGHMIPQYAPSAAYYQLEMLLGQVPIPNTS